MTRVPRSLQLRAFAESDAALVEPWLTGPGLSLPPGSAARTWARRLVTDRRIVARVGMLAGRPVAFARLDCGPDRVAEVTLVVDPAWRRRGIGRQVLAGLIAEARRRGVWRLHALVDAANAEAVEFFRDQGFEHEGYQGVSRLRFVRLVHAGDHQEPLEIEV